MNFRHFKRPYVPEDCEAKSRHLQDKHKERTAAYRVRRQVRGEQGTAAAMAAGCNDSWHGAPLPGLEKVAEHVHVGALAGHQLAQESNLLQAAVGASKATWHWRSGR